MTGLASVIIPAHNEADYIEVCLEALFASDQPAYAWSIEVIVVANGCSDDTVARAWAFASKAQERGWPLHVLDLPLGGKMGALNAGDKAAAGATRVYLDADVIVSPALMGQITEALDTTSPRYASGQPVVAPAKSWITRAYARFWQTLPFVQQGTPGFGIFAVNAAGRARWSSFPDIISDDTFVRLQFTPVERIRVDASYSWPMIEGFRNLVRVRRRQNAGVDEIAERFPKLMRNDDKTKVRGMAGRFLKDPLGFAVYGAVSLAVKSRYAKSSERWARGR